MAKKKNQTTINNSLPQQGMDYETLFQELKKRKQADFKWKGGRIFTLIYNPGKEIADMVKKAYLMFISENALNPIAFPSLKQMENEVVRMSADLLGGGTEATGSMTSGGTESILMVVKTARDWAKKNKPKAKKPEIILPGSVHPAFLKACHYFSVKPVLIPVGSDYRADVEATWKAINEQTIMLVGSAPSFPHGVVDDIPELAKLALKNDLLLHVDACVGGFMLPFIKRLGYPVPPFDFSVEGVTSISADLHKYAYACKGASLILYNDKALRKHQFFVFSGWQGGGIYASPSMGGTRPGGAIAAAWAALMGIGLNGYLRLAQQAMDATRKIKEGINQIEELQVIGDPTMTVIAFQSDIVDIYQIADELTLKGYLLDRQQDPASLHMTISPANAEIVDDFLFDLREAVEKAKKLNWNKISANIQVGAVKGLKKVLPSKTFDRLKSIAGNAPITNNKRSAALYGMMGELSGNGELDDLVLDMLDGMY